MRPETGGRPFHSESQSWSLGRDETRQTNVWLQGDSLVTQEQVRGLAVARATSDAHRPSFVAPSLAQHVLMLFESILPGYKPEANDSLPRSVVMTGSTMPLDRRSLFRQPCT